MLQLIPCFQSFQISLLKLHSLRRNPSSGSLVISETGSLERMKNVPEKRKLGGAMDDGGHRVSDRVEETRVNPESLIDDIFKDTNLEDLEKSAESEFLLFFVYF